MTVMSPTCHREDGGCGGLQDSGGGDTGVAIKCSDLKVTQHAEQWSYG